MSPGSTLTYSEVGATLSGELPAGYHHLRRAETIGNGRAVFERAARSIVNWEMHRRAGFDVEASSTEARADSSHTSTVTVSWGVGPARFSAPCEVVLVVDEDDLKGFVYGTLPGHPETGEEAFLVSIGDNDVVTMEVVAFSRPSRWYVKLAGRFGTRVQWFAAGRYIGAVRKLVN